MPHGPSNLNSWPHKNSPGDLMDELCIERASGAAQTVTFAVEYNISSWNQRYTKIVNSNRVISYETNRAVFCRPRNIGQTSILSHLWLPRVLYPRIYSNVSHQEWVIELSTLVQVKANLSHSPYLYIVLFLSLIRMQVSRSSWHRCRDRILKRGAYRERGIARAEETW